jgi:MoaA/NifB/PqqE/SkfB family radical SAM enzyme
MLMTEKQETAQLHAIPCPPARRVSEMMASREVDLPCPPARRAELGSPSPGRHVRFAWLELTGRCTLACSHCYSESGPGVVTGPVLNHEAWRMVLRRLAESGCQRIQFIGGEPTLYPGLADLVNCAAMLEFEEIEVFTNGLRVKPELFAVILKTATRLAISLHAGTPDGHDQVTGIAGSFARTADMIRSATAAGIPLRIAVIDHGNEGAARSAIEVAHRWGISEVETYALQAVGRASSSATATAARFCGLCGRDMVCVRWDGNLYPCVFQRTEPSGRVADLWREGAVPVA